MAIIRLVSGEGMTSGIIKWYTSSPYSHVEFWTPNGYLGSQAPDGVQLRPFAYTDFDKVEFREYKLPDDAETKLMQWATSQIGKPYDWLAIAALPLHRDWKDEGNWYCSEFVAEAFLQAGYPILAPGTEISKVTPRDVALSPLLTPCVPPTGLIV